MGNGMAATARRTVALIGANYGLALHPVDRDGVHVPGEPASCFATFWVADWCKWGTGTALLVATLAAPDFQLGPASASMSNVYLPCRAGRLSEFGIDWPGAPTVYPGPRGPSSSAYLAVAESWTV
jgi:hypothetical protein